ncbi:MAG TPA: sugar ABC transporter permease [Chloroflexota bacterium]|nr:sugar ABC transporter permease [Chloroflexota bacterium]
MARSDAVYPATIHTTTAARWRHVLGRDWALGSALVAPVVVIVLSLLAYPFANAIYLSFTDSMIGKGGQFVGLANYVDFFTNPNNLALKALGITVVITGSAIGGKFLLGLAMASVLNQDLPARNLWRGLMFLPWAVPAVVSAYAWRFLFDTSGPINGAIAQFQLADDYIYFFNDARLALPALILVVIWSGTPFWTMNFLAGMQSISQEMYEAAEIDGAGTFQRFCYVTVPSLQHVIFVTALLSTIWTSANLTQIFVLTGGGPNYATSTVPFLSYLTAIPGKQIGMGSAQSMLLLPFYAVLVFFLTRRMLRQD